MAIVEPPTAELGATYKGRVVNVAQFGAFVNILPGRDGLVHISKLGNGQRISKVEDVLNLGDEVTVRVDDIDDRGKVSLSLIDPETGEPMKGSGEAPRERSRDDRGGRDRDRGGRGGRDDRGGRGGRDDRGGRGGRDDRGGRGGRDDRGGRGGRDDRGGRGGRDDRGGRDSGPDNAVSVSFEDEFDSEFGSGN
jgi:polyribonucleotide nucleotidyltransferase